MSSPPWLYHISDVPGIGLFEPRTGGHGYENEAVVWAIDADHLPNYLLPRDCPRVTFFARRDTDPADVEKFFCGTSAKRIIAVESRWLERIRGEKLYQYEFSPSNFTLADETAGYYVSPEAQVPVSEREIDDVLAELLSHDVELRVMDSLWKLRDAVIASTLGFSIIRMRNAAPPVDGLEAHHPL